MCLAIPAKIVKLLEHNSALCDFNGIEKEVNVSLIEDPKENEWVIVHVGFALNRIDEAKAIETLSMMAELSDQVESKDQRL